MFEAQLFLGVEIDEQVAASLARANPRLLELLVQDASIYLQKATYRHKEYIGKYVGELAHLSQLELLELNIISLLKKLDPTYVPQEAAVLLFSCLRQPSLSEPQ